MTPPTAPAVLPAPLQSALVLLARGESLSESESHAATSAMLDDLVPEAGVAAYLTALKLKGETAEELAGAVRAVRERMMPFVTMRSVLDTCGTGGDGSCSVNVSTAVAIVAAAAGVPVAKHGNRSASGNSGSAEVLQELGIAIEAPPERLHACLERLGLTFLYAPKFHTSLRALAPVRKLLPFRTIFNLIGPLANPCKPGFQLVGVAGDRAGDLVADALLLLGLVRGAVVTGGDGLDEVSLDAPTHVRWIENGRLSLLTWAPEDFGLGTVSARELTVSGPAESAARLTAFFRGEAGPVRSAILANSAAALLVAGRVRSLEEGVATAARVVDSGDALRLLDEWRELSNG
ncbi:MAG: anthranilate phosphoribosyltransferase [Isosphaeraceae bacterium]|nr:anthranilate phosphoribosyltransferase [Isosphaeraceae bacterium]